MYITKLAESIQLWTPKMLFDCTLSSTQSTLLEATRNANQLQNKLHAFSGPHFKSNLYSLKLYFVYLLHHHISAVQILLERRNQCYRP